MKKAAFLIVFFLLAVSQTANADERFYFCTEAKNKILCFQCRDTEEEVVCRYLRGGENPAEGFVGDIFLNGNHGDQLVIDAQKFLSDLLEDQRVREEVVKKIRRK